MSYRREVEDLLTREPHIPHGVRESEICGDDLAQELSESELEALRLQEDEDNDPRYCL